MGSHIIFWLLRLRFFKAALDTYQGPKTCLTCGSALRIQGLGDSTPPPRIHILLVLAKKKSRNPTAPPPPKSSLVFAPVHTYLMRSKMFGNGMDRKDVWMFWFGFFDVHLLVTLVCVHFIFTVAIIQITKFKKFSFFKYIFFNIIKISNCFVFRLLLLFITAFFVTCIILMYNTFNK